MTNMSYCRFQNTLKALADYYENWDNDLSEIEENARLKLLELCIKIVEISATFTKD